MTLFKPDLDAPYGYVHQTVQRRRVGLESFLHSSREKPGEYCESPHELQYTVANYRELLKKHKEKMKNDQDYKDSPPGGEVSKDENLRKQTRVLLLAQALIGAVRLRGLMS